MRNLLLGGFLGLIYTPFMVLAHPVDIYDLPPYEEPEAIVIKETKNEEFIDLEQPWDFEKSQEVAIEQSEIAECEQLPVIGSAYLFLRWFISKTWYRKLMIIPASLVIAITGAYWTIELLFL